MDRTELVYYSTVSIYIDVHVKMGQASNKKSSDEPKRNFEFLIFLTIITGLSQHFLGQGTGPFELGKLSTFLGNWEKLHIF